MYVCMLRYAQHAACPCPVHVGGSNRVSLYALPTYVYMGCYATDVAFERHTGMFLQPMPGFLLEDKAMTVERCAALAVRKGFKLFALQAGNSESRHT